MMGRRNRKTKRDELMASRVRPRTCLRCGRVIPKSRGPGHRRCSACNSALSQAPGQGFVHRTRLLVDEIPLFDMPVVDGLEEMIDGEE